MKYRIAKTDVVALEYEGECTGDWVTESNFGVEVMNPYPEYKSCVVRVVTKLNVEFSNGGSVEYIGNVSAIVSGYTTKPMLMDLMHVSRECFRVGKDQFFEKIPYDGDKSSVWADWSDKSLALLLSEKMNDAFP